jgi:hypothetical protein
MCTWLHMIWLIMDSSYDSIVRGIETSHFCFKYGWLPRWLHSSCMKQHRRWIFLTWRIVFWQVAMMANCKLQMFAQWQQQSCGNNSPECDRTYWRHMHCHKYVFGDAAIAKGEIFVTYRNELKQESLNFAPKKSRYGTKLVLLIHESSHNLQTVSKSPKLTSSWLPIFKCEIIHHTKIPNPRSNFPTSSKAMHPWKQD